MKQTGCTASFDCSFPEGNVRFQKVGVPRVRSQVIVVGFITAGAQPLSNASPVKRIPIEIGEIQYLASVATSVPSSLKGSQPIILFQRRLSLLLRRTVCHVSKTRT